MRIRVGIYYREMEIGVDLKADLQQVTIISSGLHHAKAKVCKNVLFSVTGTVTSVVAFGFCPKVLGGGEDF